ncbi:MAG: DUF418 domain-containing protein [Bacteroidota bacterium]
MNVTANAKTERIISLDVIRGFAILGILLMNIQSFSMIGQAYLNPMAYGDMTGLNKWVWILSHTLADQKFMSIFSMLFGASIIMITQNQERKTGQSFSAHYRRNFWLLIIGLIHAYLFWYGDILAPYAVCAFLLYPLRKLSVRMLLVWGVIIFTIGSLIETLAGLELLNTPQEVLQQKMGGWRPHQRIVEMEVNAYLGSFPEQMEQRTKTAVMMHTETFLSHYLWRISGLMLIGMALFKSGFLTNTRKPKLYKQILAWSGAAGLSLVVVGIIKNFEAYWAIEYAKFLNAQFNYWGSLLMSVAYISGVILLIQYGLVSWLTNLLSCVGRTALSNYLMQTLICTFIFYGFGLGLFGQVERTGQLMIVIGIWVFQVLASWLWLKCFSYGPFEWLWRSLSNWKVQPLCKQAKPYS